MKLQKKKSEENEKCNLPLTDERQRSREKQNYRNNIVDYLISWVIITKLLT